MVLQRFAPAALVCLAIVASGCTGQSQDKADSARNPTVTETPMGEPVTYSHGFFPAEKDQAGQTWRWMEEDGRVLLRNNGRDSRLRLVYGAPVEKAVIRVELNGQPLDQFTAQVGNFDKAYEIPAARQNADTWSELRIVTSEVLQSKHDPRKLGLRVFDITWTPK